MSRGPVKNASIHLLYVTIVLAVLHCKLPMCCLAGACKRSGRGKLNVPLYLRGFRSPLRSRSDDFPLPLRSRSAHVMRSALQRLITKNQLFIVTVHGFVRHRHCSFAVYTVVDCRRPSVSGRCCPCLEQSAASYQSPPLHHCVSTVAA